MKYFTKSTVATKLYNWSAKTNVTAGRRRRVEPVEPTLPLIGKTPRMNNKLYRTLNRVLTKPTDWFKTLPNASVVDTKHGPCIWINNNSPVLAVGHLDAVKWNPRPLISRGKVPFVWDTPQLDDRLGVWVILNLLPHIAPGMTYDILLTDSEEIGESTAQYFQKCFPDQPSYNWGFEFDRNGTDNVLYDFDDNATWKQAVADSMGQIGQGSFSDISNLEGLGCCFANFGVGYYDQHSDKCYANLQETLVMARRFVGFYERNCSTKFEHVERPVGKHSVFYGGGYSLPTNSHRDFYSDYPDTRYGREIPDFDGQVDNWEKLHGWESVDSDDEDDSNDLDECRGCKVYAANSGEFLCPDCQLLAIDHLFGR